MPFRGDPKAKTHPVAVEVTATPQPGQAERVALFSAAVEPGKTLRATQRVTATLRADETKAPTSRYLLYERLDLKPGRYQLRLGVQSAWAKAENRTAVMRPIAGRSIAMAGIRYKTMSAEYNHWRRTP